MFSLSKKNVSIIGLLSVLILVSSLSIFGMMNGDFSFVNDLISKLGAKGQPNAFLFNLFFFIIVGILLFVFGIGYGRILKDKMTSFFLSLFGVGFAVTAIPFNMELPRSITSKSHIVAICLGLAFWMFGLARLAYNQKLRKGIRTRANFTAILLVLSMMGFVFGVWSMPITHR